MIRPSHLVYFLILIVSAMLALGGCERREDPGIANSSSPEGDTSSVQEEAATTLPDKKPEPREDPIDTATPVQETPMEESASTATAAPVQEVTPTPAPEPSPTPSTTPTPVPTPRVTPVSETTTAQYLALTGATPTSNAPQLVSANAKELDPEEDASLELFGFNLSGCKVTATSADGQIVEELQVGSSSNEMLAISASEWKKLKSGTYRVTVTNSAGQSSDLPSGLGIN